MEGLNGFEKFANNKAIKNYLSNCLRVRLKKWTFEDKSRAIL